MDEKKIARINALAKKAKGEGLTPPETAERDALRKEYIAAYRRNLESHLENVSFVETDGSHTPLKKKEE